MPNWLYVGILLLCLIAALVLMVLSFRFTRRNPGKVSPYAKWELGVYGLVFTTMVVDLVLT